MVGADPATPSGDTRQSPERDLPRHRTRHRARQWRHHRPHGLLPAAYAGNRAALADRSQTTTEGETPSMRGKRSDHGEINGKPTARHNPL